MISAWFSVAEIQKAKRVIDLRKAQEGQLKGSITGLLTQ